MEVAVRLERLRRFGRARLRHCVHELVGAVEVATRDPQGRALRRIRFEQPTRDIDALHLVEVRLGDAYAAVRLANEEPLCLELAHRLAHRGDAGVEPRCEFVLLDACSARQLS